MPTTRMELLVFPSMTQLDMTGPFEVFSRLPGAEALLLWKTLDPVTADSGLRLLPHTTMRDGPPLDVICVPGGPGVNALMQDQEVLAWLRERAVDARYISSVCTGSLVLGAAGLLRGRRATSHWASRDLLAPFGAIPTAGRVVRDGNLFTGGGVTAGIDFALTMARRTGRAGDRKDDPITEHSGGWGYCRARLRRGHRQSGTVQTLQHRPRLRGPDPAPLPVRRCRLRGTHLQMRRRASALLSVPSGKCHSHSQGHRQHAAKLGARNGGCGSACVVPP